MCSRLSSGHRLSENAIMSWMDFGLCKRRTFQLATNALSLDRPRLLSSCHWSFSGGLFCWRSLCPGNECSPSSSIDARHHLSFAVIPILMFQTRTTRALAHHINTLMSAFATAASVVGRRRHPDGQAHVQQCRALTNRH